MLYLLIFTQIPMEPINAILQNMWPHILRFVQDQNVRDRIRTRTVTSWFIAPPSYTIWPSHSTDMEYYGPSVSSRVKENLPHFVIEYAFSIFFRCELFSNGVFFFSQWVRLINETSFHYNLKYHVYRIEAIEKFAVKSSAAWEIM